MCARGVVDTVVGLSLDLPVPNIEYAPPPSSSSSTASGDERGGERPHRRRHRSSARSSHGSVGKTKHITTLGPGDDLPRLIKEQPVRRVLELAVIKFLPQFTQINQTVPIRVQTATS